MKKYKKSSGTFIENTACLNPQCGSSDAMSVYEHEEGNRDAYCWSCQTYFPKADTAEGSGRDKTFMYEDLEDIARYPSRALKDRGISEAAVAKYGVKVGIDPANGQINAHYYPYYKKGTIAGYKRRSLPKEFHTIGDMKNSELFGQHLCGDGGKLLVIVEGELDTLAAYDMFRLKGKHYRVVGLPTGANAKAIRQNLEWIEKFETVILALDQDAPGQEALGEIASSITNGKVRVAKFSEKDPNDMLIKGKVDEFFNSIMNASEFRPDGIVSIDDIFEKASKPVEWGKSWPWQTLTNLTFGRRRKEMYGFGGGTGTGKTELFKEVIDHVIRTDNIPVGVIFLEEDPAYTAKILAGKRCNKTFHIPDSGWTPEELMKSLNEMRGQVYFYDHWGSKDYQSLKNKIRYMVVTLGLKDIFLDHLTALAANEMDETKALDRIMSDLAAMTQELDFTLYYISHLATPQGTPHEEGGRVTASQFRGSRAIAFWSHFLFGLERNQQAESPEERHTITFRVLKDRYTGRSTGEKFGMGFDHTTGRLYEKALTQSVEDEF